MLACLFDDRSPDQTPNSFASWFFAGYYVEAGDVARAVAVAECPLPTYIGRFEGAAERVASALKLVPPDSHEAGRLLNPRS